MKFGLRNNVFYMGDQFTTANRYPRQVASPDDTVLTMVEGPSLKFNAVASGTNGIHISWRFECGALTFSSAGGTAVVPAVGFAVDRPLGL